MVKAIIFDMDGVLFDTETFYFQRRIDFLATKGLSVEHLEPSIFVGGRASQMWKRILADDYESWDVPALEEEYRIYKENRPTPYAERLFPDVRDSLERLKNKGLPLVLASNTDGAEIERALSEAGIATYFDQTFSGMDCQAPKPHPAVYEQAVQALGLDKKDILVFEDSSKGIAAAKAANLTVWAIRDRHYGIDQSQADRLVDSLGQAMNDLDV
ncbi:HAD family hydrolase [Streptococcus suis]|uniref:HAD family hydrolase n=1 Tax=Streptococcus suis TaxID=1307 RepID=UPI000CF49B24|nr:HAD family phosphatase [Streptococcus suis]